MKRKYYTEWILVFLCIFIFQICNSSPDYDPNEIPVTPYGIKIKAETGNKFTILYYVQNQENTFDGYNVYITRETTPQNTTTSVLKSTVQPFTFSGSVPTVIHSTAETDLNNPVTITVDNFMISTKNSDGSISNTYVPFETGTRYFFKITAHSFYEKESTFFSNEVSAVAIP